MLCITLRLELTEPLLGFFGGGAGIDALEIGGHLDTSACALNELKRNYASGMAFQIAQIHAWRGAEDQGFHWLERAYGHHDGGMSTIK